MFRLGHTVPEMALKLGLKESTVRTTVTQVKNRFGFKSSKQLLDPNFVPVYEIRVRDYSSQRFYASE
jgi:hypothetical protein